MKLNNTWQPTTPEALVGLYLRYDVEVYGCYDNNRCDKVGNKVEGTWQVVLTLRHQKAALLGLYREDQSALLIVFGNTFQNQEALPTKGKLKSYLVFVRYHNIDNGLFDGSQELEYEFLTVTRPSNSKGDPLPSSYAVFMSYVLDAFGQAAFLTIWLLFSDGLRRKQDYLRFYVPKVTMGFLIFACNVAILLLQFPTITPTDKRSPMEAVNNWSNNIKIIFISISFAFLGLMWIWTLWWFYSLWYTGRALQRLPYMSTRYLQLSFRFFLLQATLVALFYVFQYFTVIYLILKNSPLTQNLTSITDNINTLFRLQTQLIGKQ
eukprot:gene4278-5412_t